jgi:Leucine-rich repeat (LRR) protein
VLNLQNNCLCGNLPEFPLQSLTSLNLSGNKLTNIDSLSNCSSLCGLAVSHNQITRLPKFSLPLLEMMAFDNNLIESLRELSESHLPKLKRLLAEGNLLGGNL